MAGYNKLLSLIEKNPGFGLDVLNAMEAFSVYFSKGIADDEIGFKSIGLTFCDSVKKYYTLIAGVRKNEDEEHFFHITQLYKMWNQRVTKRQLDSQLNIIKKRISDLGNHKIPPIGI